MLIPYICCLHCMSSFTEILDPEVAFRQVMFAAAYILHALSGTVRSAQNAASEPFVEKLIALGVLIVCCCRCVVFYSRVETFSNTMRWTQSIQHMDST